VGEFPKGDEARLGRLPFQTELGESLARFPVMTPFIRGWTESEMNSKADASTVRVEKSRAAPIAACITGHFGMSRSRHSS
jgi:hypothetical protein